jgi:poly-gamma-glutamate system protein
MALMWRPGKASRPVLALVALLCIIGMMLVEGLPQKTRKTYYKEKIQAAKLMARGMEVIKRARISIFGRIDVEHDPLATGMIGSGLTPITSNTGVLSAKQTAANPNFAAVIVQLFKRAKLKEGDVVAMAFSGSFPSLNLASLVAAETLKLRPVIITSLSGSNWGANDPELTWLDMERLLFENGVIHNRTVAASLGAEQDRGIGLPPEGVRMLREAIKRNGVELIDAPDLASSFDLRMNIYREESGEQPITAYVNVGGGVGSVGSSLVKKMFSPGLNRELPTSGKLRDSVITRMARDGVPVIHLIYIEKLAKTYGLVKGGTPARLGAGDVYAAMGYNMWLVWGVGLGLVLVIFILLRMDLHHYGLRIRGLMSRRKKGGSNPPPPSLPPEDRGQQSLPPPPATASAPPSGAAPPSQSGLDSSN